MSRVTEPYERAQQYLYATIKTAWATNSRSACLYNGSDRPRAEPSNMQLKNPKIIDLGHQPYFLSGNPGGVGAIAASRDGSISVWKHGSTNAHKVKSPF